MRSAGAAPHAVHRCQILRGCRHAQPHVSVCGERRLKRRVGGKLPFPPRSTPEAIPCAQRVVSDVEVEVPAANRSGAPGDATKRKQLGHGAIRQVRYSDEDHLALRFDYEAHGRPGPRIELECKRSLGEGDIRMGQCHYQPNRVEPCCATEHTGPLPTGEEWSPQRPVPSERDSPAARAPSENMPAHRRGERGGWRAERGVRHPLADPR